MGGGEGSRLTGACTCLVAGTSFRVCLLMGQTVITETMPCRKP
jgi:hypothetical protein